MSDAGRLFWVEAGGDPPPDASFFPASPALLTLSELVVPSERLAGGLVLFPTGRITPLDVRSATLANPRTTFVLVLEGEIPPAQLIEWVQCGVHEILNWPPASAEVAALLDRYGPAGAEGELDRGHHLIEKFRGLGILSAGMEMVKVFETVEKVAASQSTVLITGDSGTGKELIARSIHALSGRSRNRFVAVNTGAIPENLLEDELFGHVRGAFTSAVGDRKGKFEYADGGTIFLDEISNMPPSLQVKLLRILQEREFERIGDNQIRRVDVRVVSATNQRLETLVQKGLFREDLYYRLNVIPIDLPPLHRRRQDIPILIQHFTRKYCRENGLPPKHFSLPALRVLQGHPWPGNIRQLENIVERILVMHADHAVLGPGELPPEFVAGCKPEEEVPAAPVDIPDEGISLNDVVAGVERKLILRSLEKTSWNKQQAAKLLGIKRTTLIEKIKKIQE